MHTTRWTCSIILSQSESLRYAWKAHCPDRNSGLIRRIANRRHSWIFTGIT